MLTAVAIAALILAVVSLGVLAAVLAYVRRLRSCVEDTRQAVERLAERPVAPESGPLVVTPAPVVAAPQRRPEASTPAPQSVLSAMLSLLVLKGAAFSYGLSQALSQERRDQAADVMNAHLRARRRARRAAERRSRRGHLP